MSMAQTKLLTHIKMLHGSGSTYGLAQTLLSCFVRALFLGVFVIVSVISMATAQTQRLDITEGQIAPIPVAIAEFTGLDGLPSDVGRQIAQIISDDLVGSGLFSTIDSAAFIKPPESPSI